MRRTRVVLSLLSFWSLLWANRSTAADREPRLLEAWRHYERGDVREADRLARSVLEARPADEDARRLVILAAHLTGDHGRACAEYDALSATSALRRKLAPLVVNSLEHLGRLSDAASLARRTGQPDRLCRFLDQRAARPLSVSLEKTIVVPFAGANFLGDLMPAVEVVINGQRRVAHLDTGGNYVVMAPSTAAALGITTIDTGAGRASTRATHVASGIVDTLEIGQARLSNVPLAALSVLDRGDMDPRLAGQVLLGTNVLQQFLTTWDNGRKRLVLSPRGNPRERQAHMALIPEPVAKTGFLMLGDHFMLAKGAVGPHADVLFFVDSGLVTLDDRGRQPALGLTSEVAGEWGLGLTASARRFADAPGEVALGPLRRTGLGVMLLDFARGIDWHGLGVRGLIGHGFLHRYVWTLDFDNYEYLFSEIAAPLAAASPAIAGRYEIAPGVAFEVTCDGGSAFLQAPGQRPVPLTPADDGSFVIQGAGATVAFTRSGTGEVTGLVLEQAGRRTEAKRLP